MKRKTGEGPMRWRLWLLALALTGMLRATLFGVAGRWDLPFFWAYLGISFAVVLQVGLTAALDLVREPMRTGPGGPDGMALLRFPGLVFCGGHWVLAGLAVRRYHRSDTIQAGVQVAGLVGMAAAVGVV